MCSQCAAGGSPTVDAARNAEIAAVLASTEPNSAAECDAKLARSLEVARAYADDCPADQRRGDFVPFRFQRKVLGEELAFALGDSGVYVGSEYGAADVSLLRGLGISRVINITTGSRKVPNFGEHVAGFEVAYKNVHLDDRIGTDVGDVVSAMHAAAADIEAWLAEGRRVLVHCSAGLCRSTTLAMGWLMAGRRRLSLSAAVAAMSAARGRPPVPSASYASALARFEREAVEARGELPPAAPTADFTEGFVDDFAVESGAQSLQLAPEAVLRRMLKDANGDADAVFRKLLQ